MGLVPAVCQQQGLDRAAGVSGNLGDLRQAAVDWLSRLICAPVYPLARPYAPMTLYSDVQTIHIVF
jgi:hypothetical protein